MRKHIFNVMTIVRLLTSAILTHLLDSVMGLLQCQYGGRASIKKLDVPYWKMCHNGWPDCYKQTFWYRLIKSQTQIYQLNT